MQHVEQLLGIFAQNLPDNKCSFTCTLGLHYISVTSVVHSVDIAAGRDHAIARTTAS